MRDLGAGYELIDVGGRRRLERFSGVVVDRPAPAAEEAPRHPRAWVGAQARFEVGWTIDPPLPDPWILESAGLTLELRATSGGQVGVFPEQATLLPWLVERVKERDRPSVLHLFAYTGLATLALARAGARVTHVDAARGALAWARENARRSGLGEAPIRWLVDDAVGFVRREVRRGTRYDGIVLDPPSYGHGPSGRAWRLADDLDPLLADCAALASPGAFVVLTSHTPGEDTTRLATRLEEAFPGRRAVGGTLVLTATSGAVLPLGAQAGIMGG